MDDYIINHIIILTFLSLRARGVAVWKLSSVICHDEGRA